MRAPAVIPTRDFNYQEVGAMPFDKRLWRAATQVREWYAGGDQELPKPAQSLQAWQQLEAQIRRLSRALHMGWQRASQRIRIDLAYDARSLQHELDKLVKSPVRGRSHESSDARRGLL